MAWQVYNGLALLLVSMHPRFSSHRFAGPAIIAGGLIFSGSIMALVLGQGRYVVYIVGVIVADTGQIQIFGPSDTAGGYNHDRWVRTLSCRADEY